MPSNTTILAAGGLAGEARLRFVKLSLAGIGKDGFSHLRNPRHCWVLLRSKGRNGATRPRRLNPCFSLFLTGWASLLDFRVRGWLALDRPSGQFL